MNEQIQESNHIKEEYIGLLFNICSEYIYKQENDRKALLKIANTRRYGGYIKDTSADNLPLPMISTFHQ